MTNQIALSLGAGPYSLLSSYSLTERARLRKPAEGNFNKAGQFTAGEDTIIDVLLATAPMTGQERETLPEGFRDKDVRTFWIHEAVTAVTPGARGTTGDRIEYGGCMWQVIRAEVWGGFHHVVGVRQD